MAGEVAWKVFPHKLLVLDFLRLQADQARVFGDGFGHDHSPLQRGRIRILDSAKAEVTLLCEGSEVKVKPDGTVNRVHVSNGKDAKSPFQPELRRSCDLVGSSLPTSAIHGYERLTWVNPRDVARDWNDLNTI